jgi:hypothetical protein
MVIKDAFVGKKNFDFIKMHGTTIKIKNLTDLLRAILFLCGGIDSLEKLFLPDY